MFMSTFRELGDLPRASFPTFSGERVMMMPVVMGDFTGAPKQYLGLINELSGFIEARFLGLVGYLTIDEQRLPKGRSLRRLGKHVDGVFQGRCGAWGGGSWGSVGGGMITASSTSHCRAYPGLFDGSPGPEGECDHLAMPNGGVLLKKYTAYWLDGLAVHESLPVDEDTTRQFLRLSMPSNGPWFVGYTENPTGVAPTGKILPRRKFL